MVNPLAEDPVAAEESNLPPFNVSVPPGMFASAATETVPAVILRLVFVSVALLVLLNINVPVPVSFSNV